MWRDSVTGTVVTWHGGIRELRPNVSMPSILSDQLIKDLGFDTVKQMPPNNSYLERAEPLPPINIDGVWVQQWKIEPVTSEEASILNIEHNKNIKNTCITRTQNKLDQFAQTRGYDSILSACTYASSLNIKFSLEGQCCLNLRDATWTKLLEILKEIEQGIRDIPTTYEEIESELPVLSWSS